jgi:anti-sigma regulatory factor (Ser/Thr protein kinase)
MDADDRAELRVRLPAVPESVSRARTLTNEWCARYTGMDGRLSDVLIAVTEAAANVVVHAYPDGGCGDFELVLRDDHGRLIATVRDEGIGYYVPSANPGLGSGLLVIQRACDSSAIDAAEPGTIVTMRFRIPATS